MAQVATTGKLTHVEWPAEDTSRARKFWGGLFGYEFQSYEGPVEYHMFQGEPGGAIYPSQSGERGPVVYFDTSDIDASMKQVRDLGGWCDDKAPVPGMGWYARCKDTEGNSFSFWQNDDSAPTPEGWG
jgi:predicted enzyme related to lactoylglutathione lyase